MPLMRCIGWDAFISVIYLTVGSLKEDKGKVEMASDIEVDAGQADPRSDDDDDT